MQNLVLLSGVMAGACSRDEIAADQAGRSRPAAGATVGTILDEPFEHFGDEVTVQAEVKRVLKPGAFTVLTADRLRELLVIAGKQAQKAVPQVTAESRVNVVGVVHRFEPESLKEETLSRLDETSAREWIGKPVIVAREISLLAASVPRIGPPEIRLGKSALGGGDALHKQLRR